MPHTNRKKKPSDAKVRADHKPKFSHSKREYISSEDGWTHVADKGWKSILSKDKSNTAMQSLLVDMTFEEMVKEHERYKKQWGSSDACARLESALSDTEIKGRCTVENMVCLGLGSLQALSLEWRRSSHTQLAALTTIRTTLCLSDHMIMQDPRFTDLDKMFLKSMAYEVVDDPEAFQHINENSVVYAIHCPIHLLRKVKESADPALLIGNDLRSALFNALELPPTDPNQLRNDTKLLDDMPQGIEEQRKRESRCLEEVLPLIRDCEEIAFPQLRYDFSDTVIYWRHSQNSKNSQEAVMEIS